MAAAVGVPAGLIAFSSQAQAQVHTWTGATDGTYHDPSNWGGGDVPDTNTEGALFDASATTFNVAVGSATTVNAWTLTGGTSYTISGSAVTFDGAGAGLTNTSTVQQTISNDLTGAGATVTQNGTGTLTLSGANTYTGATTVSAGTLQAGAANAFGSNSATSVAGGATLDLNNFNQTVGSLTGAGNVTLGSATLSTGADNSSTAFSGVISGSGGLTKQGIGTFTVSGANTYTGATTVSGGTLQAGAANVFGSNSAVTVGGSGTLALNNNNQTIGSLAGSGNVTLGSASLSTGADNSSTAFSGVISGSGGLTKQGTGTFTVSGANTYTGATTVSGGTLQAGAANVFGSNSAVTVGGSGTLALNNNNQTIGSLAGSGNVTLGSATLSTGANNSSSTFSGTISGSGGLTKQGTGTFTLTGANTYTGGTTISGGTLQLGSGGTTGAISGNVVNNGVLAVNRSNSYTFGGSISGTGSFRQIGTGTTVLTGANTYTGGTTISAGTLVGSSTSFGTGGILNNASLVFNQSTNGSFGSSISGSGTLRKQGTGSLVLTGNSTLTGATTVQEGALVVNGSLANSTVTVNGGTLGGNGTIGGLVANGGTIAPGNSIGTLNVAGNVTFNAGSTYQVEVDADGRNDRINATGTATLLGGTVSVLAGGNYQPSTSYTILQASGGVSGRFGAVFTNLAFLTPELSYTATGVILTLDRNDIRFTQVATTANQTAVAAALETVSVRDPLIKAVFNQTVEGAQQAFNALSGEVHATVQSVIVEDSRHTRQAVLGRLRQDAYAGSDALKGTLGAGGPATYMADAPRRAAVAPQSIIKPAFTAWAHGIGAWGKFDGDGNATKADRTLAGVFGGVDTDLSEVLRVGLASGYTRSELDINAGLGSAEIDTGHVAAYAGGRFGALSTRVGGAVSFHNIDTHRTIAFPTFSERATASYDARTNQVFGEVGYGFAVGQLALEPFAGLAWVQVENDGFREQGGVAALTGGNDSFETGYSTLGVRLGSRHHLANGMALMPRVSVGWQHAFDDVRPAATLAFASGSSAFTVRGAPIARDSAVVEAGVDLAVSSRAQIGVSYSGALADKVEDHAVKGNYSLRF